MRRVPCQKSLVSIALVTLVAFPGLAAAQVAQTPVQQVPPGSTMSIVITPPQLVYYCYEEVDMMSIILSPTWAEAQQRYAALRAPGKSGYAPCDYFIDTVTEEYTAIGQIDGLTLVGDLFTIMADDGAAGVIRMYRGLDAGGSFYVALGHLMVAGEVQAWGFDYMSVTYGQ